MDRHTHPSAQRTESERRDLLDRLAATFDDPATAGIDWDAMCGSWRGPIDAEKLVRHERLRDE